MFVHVLLYSSYVQGRNVLWVIVDDMRTDMAHMTDQTGIITPNFVSFAQLPGTVTMDGAYVQQAVCGPSRQSFMTGRRPDSTRVWNHQDSFRTYQTEWGSKQPSGSEWVTFPQAFKQQGYRTVGIGKLIGEAGRGAE